MLSNFLSLRQFYKDEKENEFFNKVHVMSLELTAESIQLSCYWATRSEGSDIKYYGMKLRTWTPYESDSYKEARRCTCNALDWVQAQAFDWISSAMKTLDGAVSVTAPTPPSSQSDQLVQETKSK